LHLDENKDEYHFLNFYSNKIKVQYKKIAKLYGIHFHYHQARLFSEKGK